MIDIFENIFVTVIIPVYNDQTGISACLTALNSQSFSKKCFEVIIVDNNSNPPINLDQIFSDFAHIVIAHTPGSYAARNVGVAVAQGNILAFTDADCRPDPDWIITGVRALVLGKESVIIGGEVAFIKSEKLTSVEHYQQLVGFQQRKNIENMGFTATANLFVSLSQFCRIGPFNEDLLSGGDREWCWRAAKAGYSVKYVSNAIVRTTARISISTAIRQARRVEGGRRALRRIRQDYIQPSAINPHLSTLQSAKWILKHPELSSVDRIKIFAVASIIKLSRFFESVILSFGKSPERR